MADVGLDWLYGDNDADYGMTVNTLKYTDERTVRRVYALGRTLARVMGEVGLLYWTSSGTTLGIVRHGGLIPWDDDIDICISSCGLNIEMCISNYLKNVLTVTVLTQKHVFPSLF